MGGKKVSIRVISTTDKLLKIERIWNNLIGECTENPFFLSGFITQLMKFNCSKGWTPLVLVISVDNMIIGTVPLMTRKKFGTRFVKFLPKSSYSPDFIVCDRYREICITYTLDFLFKTSRCRFADFTFQAESPNLRVLKQMCKTNRTHFWATPDIGHRMLSVKGTWDEFKKLRGKKFRQEFRSIERKLNRAGSWRIILAENGNEGLEAIEKILDVEKMSWKESWRALRGAETDENLLMVLKASQHTARIEPKFKWSVWFLQLNDQTLSYSLVIQYKEAAFIQKTSYDERYKRFYPGKYVINAAIRGLFNKREIKNIDFLTDLPFVRIWASTSLPRVRIMIAKGLLPTILGSMFANAHLKKILRALLDLLPVHWRIL